MSVAWDVHLSPSMYLGQLRRALCERKPVDDVDFDRVYDEGYRQVSRRYWTPVETARRAADLLVGEGAQRILDVGSGVGKFCIVAAASVRGATFIGVEQRAHLVRAAHDAVCRFDMSRVRIIHGRLEAVATEAVDGFYLFNPFAENLCGVGAGLDDTVHLSAARFESDVAQTTAILAAAAPGTPVVTYYGYGARMPAQYLLVNSERQPSGGSLDLWVKDGEGRS